MLKKTTTEPATTVGLTPIQKCRKWLLRSTIFLMLLIAVLAMFFKISFDRVESKAALVNRTGVSLNKFFKDFSKALETKDITAGMACFANPEQEVSSLDKTPFESRDNVKSFRWNSKSAREIGQQLERLTADFENIEFVKTKIMSMREVTETNAKVKALVWLRGVGPAGNVESKVQFNFGVQEYDTSWKITDLELLSGRTVEGNGAGFTDITQAAGISFESTHNPMLNKPEWFPETFGIMRYASAGVSVCDFNGDGNQDIFFSDGTNPTLYRGKGDGTFEDAMDETCLLYTSPSPRD